MSSFEPPSSVVVHDPIPYSERSEPTLEHDIHVAATLAAGIIGTKQSVTPVNAVLIYRQVLEALRAPSKR